MSDDRLVRCGGPGPRTGSQLGALDVLVSKAAYQMTIEGIEDLSTEQLLGTHYTSGFADRRIELSRRRFSCRRSLTSTCCDNGRWKPGCGRRRGAGVRSGGGEH